MTLQAKLTLGTVLLATFIVAIISAVYLGNIMDLQFESAQREAGRVGDVALRYVRDAANSASPDVPLTDALASSLLTDQLKTEVAASTEIVEVAVVDGNGTILADNNPNLRGQLIQPLGELSNLVRAGWLQKV